MRFGKVLSHLSGDFHERPRSWNRVYSIPFTIFFPGGLERVAGGGGGGELYTDKWWNTHDLFLGWIYYLFSSDLNEKPLEDELYRLPRSGVPQIFQNFIPGTWFPAKANNSVSIAESQSNVFVIFSSRCLLQLQVLDVN